MTDVNLITKLSGGMIIMTEVNLIDFNESDESNHKPSYQEKKKAIDEVKRYIKENPKGFDKEIFSDSFIVTGAYKDEDGISIYIEPENVDIGGHYFEVSFDGDGNFINCVMNG